MHRLPHVLQACLSDDSQVLFACYFAIFRTSSNHSETVPASRLLWSIAAWWNACLTALRHMRQASKRSENYRPNFGNQSQA